MLRGLSAVGLILVASRLELSALGALLSLNLFLIVLLLARPGEFRLWTLSLLGFAVPVAPWLGNEFLLGWGLSALLWNARWSQPEWTRWARPLLILLLVWVVVELINAFCSLPIELVCSALNYSFEDALKWWQSSPPFAVLGAVQFFRVVLLVGVCAFVWSSVQEERSAVLNGVVVGFVVAAALTSIQLVAVDVLPFPNFTDHWRSLGRWPGTFSDPNSFGLAVVLALPLFWRLREGAWSRLAALGLTIVWLVLLAFSGSRTGVLGVVLFGLGVLWCYRRAWAYGVLVLGGVLVFILNGLALLLPELWLSGSEALPVSLRRVYATLTVVSSTDPFWSRLVFNRIGWSIWEDNFFWGIGFQRFRYVMLPYLPELNLPLGTWIDNPNNFYLGILAELGLVGALVFMWSMLRLERERSDYNPSQVAVYVMLVLWLTGPHHEFDEVACLLGLNLALGFRPGIFERKRWLNGLLFVLVSLGVFTKGFGNERGFYAWELEGELFQRWMAGSAKSVVVCTPGEATYSFQVRSLAPDLSEHPLHLRVKAHHGYESSIALDSSQWTRVEVPCPAEVPSKVGGGELGIKLTTDRLWIPALSGLGGDHRLLSVQIRGLSPVGGR